MSKIDRLSILGVRSFNNRTSETIQFYTPLTLIVGYNGSGKTTIIECLKYATTGEVPPNTGRGAAFVHDPNLCGEKEVLAQVKVSFKSNDGRKMICTRSLQLTVKKTARSVQTLESNMVLKPANGEKRVISSRVVELNTLVPECLGVSRAILENVIFCHQDEALWPLAAPGDLKKRFDEIFEALKYTKAIENIKIMQKNKRIELNVLKANEASSKENKDKAARDKKRINVLEKEVDDLKDGNEKKRDQIKDLATKVQHAAEKASDAYRIVGELNGLRIERQSKQESVQSLRETLQEMEDDDETLQNMLDQYQERVSTYEKDREAGKVRYGELQKEIENGRTRVSAKERDVGMYQAQKESFDRQVEGRQQLVKTAARTFGMYGFDYDINEAKVAEFVDTITKKAKKQVSELEKARSEVKEQLAEAQKVITHIETRKSALNQRKNAARESIASGDVAIKELQAQMNTIHVNEGDLTSMRIRSDDIDRKLTAAKQSLENSQFDTKISTLEAEVEQQDSTREKLDNELDEATAMAGATAQLDFVQKELRDRQKGLETMRGAHRDRIDKIVGHDWEASTIEALYQRTLGHADAELDEARKQHDGIKHEMDQLDYKLNICTSDLSQKQRALKSAAKSIKDAADCDPEDFVQTLRDLESSRDQLKEDTDSIKLVIEYLDACLRDAGHKDGGCRTCKRGFKNDSERRRMVDAVQKEKDRRTSELGKAPEEFAAMEEELKNARAAQTEFDTWERLHQKEIPALQKEEKALSMQREKLVQQAETQDGIVSERQSSRRDVDAIKNTIASITSYAKDIAGFQSTIEELQSKQKSQGLSRGVEAIREEIRKISDSTKAAKAKLAKLVADRDRSRAAVNTLELEIRDVRHSLQKAETHLEEKTRLEADVERHKTNQVSQRGEINTVEQDLQRLGPEQAQAVEKYDDIARRGDARIGELEREKNKIETSLYQLKTASEEINRYIADGKAAQLEQGKRQVDDLKTQVTVLERQTQEIVREVKEIENTLRNHEQTRRSIAENLRYRRDTRALQQVCARIAELETRNAEEDHDYWEGESRKWQVQRNEANAEKATIFGQLQAKDDQLKGLLETWDHDYKDADKKYKRAHIEVETTKAAIDDLGKYGGALDKAIMKYHSVKMEEINRIIDELWRKTYQGTDVDTILIRSENETQSKGKSYNYRVCMIKQEAEMDMRGRCSAGQKVLASIIIRLALAECFGVNCGIIALDEPTTNLDRENIQALAESLAEIIKVRRQQRNFQLIVITHDEEFLRHMQCGDFADFYWRVSRDPDQKSIIERQNIAQVL